MQNYELRYLKRDGSVAATRVARCPDDGAAKSLALETCHSAARQIEVWLGATLIFTRPARRASLLGLFAQRS